MTMLGGVAILLTVALAASWIPARRAARVQPMEALRHE
jgi:ABC-type lipoprotein release transport system permease subunit